MFPALSDILLAKWPRSQLVAIKLVNTMLLSAGTMAKTMKISCNNHNHALIHNRNPVPAKLFETEQRNNWSNEAALGFSTSALTSSNLLYKIVCTLESLANVQLALIGETHDAPYLYVSCDPIG